MEPIAIAVNDLGEPDAGNPPVRFDEGGRLCAFYSTPSAFCFGNKAGNSDVKIPRRSQLLRDVITLGIPFWKGPVQRMKAGKRAMRVDFLVHVWDIAANRARWIILEVDPNNSANEEASKIERIKVCKKAGTAAVSYDSVRDKGLLEALRKARYEPLGA